MALAQEEQRGLFGGAGDWGAAGGQQQGPGRRRPRRDPAETRNQKRAQRCLLRAISSGMWDKAPPRRAAVV